MDAICNESLFNYLPSALSSPRVFSSVLTESLVFYQSQLVDSMTDRKQNLILNTKTWFKLYTVIREIFIVAKISQAGWAMNFKNMKYFRHKYFETFITVSYFTRATIEQFRRNA